MHHINPLAFVRERSFDKEIKRLAGNYSRMHEFDLAVEWAISHNPKQFPNICEDYYIWKTERIITGVPQLIIIYQYIESENKVIFVSVCEVK